MSIHPSIILFPQSSVARASSGDNTKRACVNQHAWNRRRRLIIMMMTRIQQQQSKELHHHLGMQHHSCTCAGSESSSG
eukprot:m.72686 g.72686  ORF g.72686 m.72686 type:complete len:78 (+) comp14422_c0_seq2:1171-1404(+)